jgi:ribosomal protein S18 acetylase RimI-like enzyme
MEALNAELGPGVRLRPMTPEDLPFLAELYASTRERELAPVMWTAAEKAAFLSFQFHCQHQHYQQNYTDARFDVIESQAEPIGRLYLASLGEDLRIIDIALIPGAQRRGLGTRLLQAVIERARSEGKSVSIHVERDNPALALYQRLGFEQCEDRGVYLFLVHPAQPALHTVGHAHAAQRAVLVEVSP